MAESAQQRLLWQFATSDPAEFGMRIAVLFLQVETRICLGSLCVHVFGGRRSRAFRRPYPEQEKPTQVLEYCLKMHFAVRENFRRWLAIREAITIFSPVVPSL